MFGVAHRKRTAWQLSFDKHVAKTDSTFPDVVWRYLCPEIRVLRQMFRISFQKVQIGQHSPDAMCISKIVVAVPAGGIFFLYVDEVVECFEHGTLHVYCSLYAVMGDSGFQLDAPVKLLEGKVSWYLSELYNPVKCLSR